MLWQLLKPPGFSAASGGAASAKHPVAVGAAAGIANSGFNFAGMPPRPTIPAPKLPESKWPKKSVAISPQQPAHSTNSVGNRASAFASVFGALAAAPGPSPVAPKDASADWVGSMTRTVVTTTTSTKSQEKDKCVGKAVLNISNRIVEEDIFHLIRYNPHVYTHVLSNTAISFNVSLHEVLLKEEESSCGCTLTA